MSSTIETLERELATAQAERESEERAVVRAGNAHEAACSERDDAWVRGDSRDPEVVELTTLVYERRRKLYESIDLLKAAEGRERRIKSRLMYVLPAERRRYLSGVVDEEFHALLGSIEKTYRDASPNLDVSVVTVSPGDLDLNGDATWRALERLYGNSPRRWVKVSDADGDHARKVASHISYYAGGHMPRLYVGTEEVPFSMVGAEHGFRPLPGYDSEEGRRSLARITAHRYLDESTVSRLCKRGDVLVHIADLARLYQTMNLTVDEIRWRLEQLVSLRLEILKSVYELTGERRRFSFYEIARAARLLDSHFPAPEVASDALKRAVQHTMESGVPLVDVAYMDITGSDITGSS